MSSTNYYFGVTKGTHNRDLIACDSFIHTNCFWFQLIFHRSNVPHNRLWHMRRAIGCVCLCTHLKHRDVLKKAHLVWLTRLQGVLQIARPKQSFLVFYLSISIKHKDLTIKYVPLFVILLFQRWKLYYIYISFTKRTTDFNRLKKHSHKKR